MKKMTNEEDKKRWKKEAAQLKADLKNRPKVIKKREVEIKFPKKTPNNSTHSTNINKTNKTSDDFYRNQINFQ